MITVVDGCVVDLDRYVLFCVGFSVAGEELCVCGGGSGGEGVAMVRCQQPGGRGEWEDGTKKFSAGHLQDP